MAKQGEIDYLRNLGPRGQALAFDKPFSDIDCGRYLVDMGLVMSLMPRPPAKVLDLGAGSGWTSVFFARRGFQVVGQDISPDMIEMANRNRERNHLDNLTFVQCDFEQMPFREEFDVAIFYDCLHHSLDEEQAMRSAYAALRKGGLLITVEPGVGHGSTETSKMVMEKYGVTEKDMPPHLIISAGKRIGFTQAEVYERVVKPMKFVSPWRPCAVLNSVYWFLRSIVRRMRESNIVVLTK